MVGFAGEAEIFLQRNSRIYEPDPWGKAHSMDRNPDLGMHSAHRAASLI